MLYRMSCKWRWRVDDKPTQQSDTPSAKILPFNLGSRPYPVELTKAPAIPHELLGVISQAIDDAPWASADRADHEALEDEQVFRKRFGFIINRARREKVLNLKHDADLTDREIRLLWWTSNLDLNGNEATITASRIVQIWGYIQMVILGLLMFIGILKAVDSVDRTFQQLVALVIAEGVIALILLGVEYLYVRPYLILKRILDEQEARQLNHPDFPGGSFT